KAVEGGFVLTARAENFFTGEPDLDDTIARLQAYQEAGADVLYAPGLRTMEDIKSVLYNVDRPLNVLLGPFERFVPLSDVLDLGVARISLGPALSNAAYGALHTAAKALLSEGDLGFLASAIDSDLRDKLLMTGAASHSQS
ncbi:MAG: isocitrate lyase/phosphoenolpyruvate mutase family protein, partial [Pseudomonadota bacterium]